MLALVQSLKLSLRDDLGSLLFFVVAGTVALAFIGYLFFDYIKTLRAAQERKKRHRAEHPHTRHIRTPLAVTDKKEK